MNEQQNQEILDKEQRVYELGYLLVPSLDEQQVSGEIEKIEKLINKISDEIVSSANPELIDLAYTIKVDEGGHYSKYDKAYFGWIKFVAYPDELDELKEELKFDKNIMRYILVKTVKEDTRAQLEQEAIQKLDEVRSGASAQAPSATQDSDELSDEEIDKVVEELLAKIDDDIEEDEQEKQPEEDKKDTKAA